MLDMLKQLVNDRVKVNIDRISGVLTVTARMPESRLSADVANQIASSLNNFVVEKNREVAAEATAYIEGRLAEGRDSLTVAEDRLKVFHLRNRTIGASPELVLEESRLARMVELRQAVYVELQRQYEIGRIEQQNQTPVVTFREPAKEPVRKTGPRRSVMLLAVMLFSAVITSLMSLHGAAISRAVATIRASPGA
jgi:uncharacterized protein involved in exopolysaccharide biosynthesis